MNTGAGNTGTGTLQITGSYEAFYNRQRRHSALGFLTPAQAYEQMARAA